MSGEVRRPDGPGGGAPAAPPVDGESSVRARIGVADLTAGLAGLAAVAIFLVWFQRSAGFQATAWLPGALLLVALLAIVVVSSGGISRLGRAQSLAVASLAGFVAWSYLSISWAEEKGDAWTGANRNLLYLATFLLFVLLPWTRKAAYLVTVTYAAGVTALAAHAIVHASTSTDDPIFINGRFAYPTDYPNANVAVFLFAFWIAVAVGTRREQPAAVRAVALGAAAFLPQAALLSQARTALVVVPATALVLVAVGPNRLRTAAGLVFGLVPLVLTWDVHLEVFREADAEGPYLETAMQPAARWMAATAVAAAVVGLAWALADRRVELSRRATRALNVTAATLGVVLVVGSAVVALRADPNARIREGWRQFTTVTSHYEEGSRFESLGGGRHDFWRVALARWQDHPVRGIGVENFAIDYLRDRHTDETPKYPHSLEVGILSQLGLVGLLFFGTFATITIALALPRGDDSATIQIVRLAGFAIWLYWLLHASFDWFLEIPAVTAPAMAFAGLSVALAHERRARAPSRLAARAAVVTTCVATLVAFAALGAPWLAAREVENAVARWRVDPDGAFERLDRARELNPLSDEADLIAGAIAAKLDRRQRMRLSFARALERNPASWYAHLELGLTYSIEGQPKAALREVREALELNPRDEVLKDVIARLEKGEAIPPRSLDAIFVERITSRIT
jgi:hypothetical protein